MFVSPSWVCEERNLSFALSGTPKDGSFVPQVLVFSLDAKRIFLAVRLFHLAASRDDVYGMQRTYYSFVPPCANGGATPVKHGVALLSRYASPTEGGRRGGHTYLYPLLLSLVFFMWGRCPTWEREVGYNS